MSNIEKQTFLTLVVTGAFCRFTLAEKRIHQDILYLYFTSSRVKVHKVLIFMQTLPHSLDSIIHGILIVSCLTLLKKVSKSQYENFYTNIGENSRSIK